MKKITGLSIIVPTLNSTDNLRKFISSLYKQTFSNWKLILIDGNSLNYHKNYLKGLTINDRRIMVEQQLINYHGIYGAMNQGIKYVRDNDWIAFWGSDDWLPNNYVLENLFNELMKIKGQENLDLFFCKVNYVMKNKFIRSSYLNSFIKKINIKNFRTLLKSGEAPPHQGTLFSPCFFTEKKLYDESYYIASDLEYFHYLSKRKNLNIYLSDIELLNLSPGGASSKKTFLKIKDLIHIFLKYYGFLFFIPFVLRYLKRIKSIIR